MASNTTKDIGGILDRCADAVTAREAIGAPVSRKRLNGASRREAADWACSDAGQAALKEIIEALRIERKALKKLRKAARELARAIEPKPQASESQPSKPLPGKAPAPSVAHARTMPNLPRKSGQGVVKAAAVAERPRTANGKARPGARKRGASAGKPL